MLSRFRSGGLLINSVWVNSILYWFLPSIEKRLYRIGRYWTADNVRFKVDVYREYQYNSKHRGAAIRPGTILAICSG